MRIRCTKPTSVEVERGKHVGLDAHHEYYLDDNKAEKLIAAGAAVALDHHGRPVERRQAKPKPAPQVTADAGSEVPEKPATRRTTKATQPPATKKEGD
ncbi:hypothetical protein [Streptomyces sp. NPDC007063]|uniref:hypothetical protein n=1 Tax=Streptomyces sp. NPDC007063 TaxID=3364772 RepID=UPI0036ACEEB3